MAKDTAGQGRRPSPHKPQTLFAGMEGRLAAGRLARPRVISEGNRGLAKAAPRPVPCSADKPRYPAYTGEETADSALSGCLVLL